MSKPENRVTVYLDGLDEKRTAPWIIRDYRGKGALTDAVKAQIIEQFDLKSALVDELSILVGNSLDEGSAVSLTKVTREKAVERGLERLEEAARCAKRMRTDHVDLKSKLSQLQTYFDDSARAAPFLAALQKDLAGIQSVVSSLESRIDELIKIENGIAEVEPDDKRNRRDARREHVVRSCCYIWEDAGRNTSYTSKSTGPKDKRRRGPLIDLVHVVTQAVTEPPTKLKVETIRYDIDRFNVLRDNDRI